MARGCGRIAADQADNRRQVCERGDFAWVERAEGLNNGEIFQCLSQEGGRPLVPSFLRRRRPHPLSAATRRIFEIADGYEII